jgi:DNA replication protein DnaC
MQAVAQTIANILPNAQPVTVSTITQTSGPSCKCGTPLPAKWVTDICQRCADAKYSPRAITGEEYNIESIPTVYFRFQPKPVKYDGQGFLTLLGRAGAGKSVTAAHVARQAAKSKTLKVEWINCAELMLRIRASFRDGARETEEEVIKSVARAQVLVVDDLASEKVSDYSTSTLYLILNRRGERMKPTIVTSNLTLKEIADTLGDRIANRLTRFGSIVTVT